MTCHLLGLRLPRKWVCKLAAFYMWAPSSEFVFLSIPSWQISTAHAQPFRGARDLAFCLKVPLDSLFVWASSEGSGETARMRRLTWTFAARIGDKYQIRLTRSMCLWCLYKLHPGSRYNSSYKKKKKKFGSHNGFLSQLMHFSENTKSNRSLWRNKEKVLLVNPPLQTRVKGNH